MERTQMVGCLLLGGLVLVPAFSWFVWPTPYEYTRKAPNVWRVNRFSGVQEVSTDNGWRTESALKAEADAEFAKGESKREADLEKKKKEREAEEKVLSTPRWLVVQDLGGADGRCSIAFRDSHLYYSIILDLKGPLRQAWTSTNKELYYVVAKFTDANGLELASDRATLTEFTLGYAGPSKAPTQISLSRKVFLVEEDFKSISGWSPLWNWR